MVWPWRPSEFSSFAMKHQVLCNYPVHAPICLKFGQYILHTLVIESAKNLTNWSKGVAVTAVQLHQVSVPLHSQLQISRWSHAAICWQQKIMTYFTLVKQLLKLLHNV